MMIMSNKLQCKYYYINCPGYKFLTIGNNINEFS